MQQNADPLTREVKQKWRKIWRKIGGMFEASQIDHVERLDDCLHNKLILKCETCIRLKAADSHGEAETRDETVALYALRRRF